MILQTLAENVLQQSRTNAKTTICAELHSKSQSALSLFTNRLFHIGWLLSSITATFKSRSAIVQDHITLRN